MHLFSPDILQAGAVKGLRKILLELALIFFHKLVAAPVIDQTYSYTAAVCLLIC